MKQKPSTHPAIAEHETSFGIRLANRASEVVGSWTFLIVQSIILAFWIVFNTTAWIHHWDGPPFILLNLMLSFQAAFSTPLILLSSNAAYKRDRKLWELDYATTQADKESTEKVLKLLNDIHDDLERKVEKVDQKIERKVKSQK